MRFLLLLPFLFSLPGCVGAADPFTAPSPARLNELWRQPGKASIEELLAAALARGNAQDWERATFFMWCAQVRAQYERAIFPPTEAGGDSPTLAYFAIGQTALQTYLPMLYASPKAHRSVLNRIKDYVPDSNANYRPNWTYGPGIAKAEAQAQAQKMTAAIIAESTPILKLTAIPKYLESLNVWLNWADQTAERSAQLKAANDAMWQIEEENKIRSGIAYRPRPTGSPEK